MRTPGADEGAIPPEEQTGGESVLEAEAAFRREVRAGAIVRDPVGGKGDTCPSHPARMGCRLWDPPSASVPDDLAPLNVKPTDPVIQPRAEARERRARDTEERFDLMWRQLDSHLETRADRVEEKVHLKAGIARDDRPAAPNAGG